MGWLDNLLLKRVIGAVVRRLVDLLAGALLASTIPVIASLGSWVHANDAEIEALILSIVLALGSLAWSYLQKKADRQEIKRLRGER